MSAARRARSLVCLAALLTVPALRALPAPRALTASPEGPTSAPGQEYKSLIARYRAGETREAVARLATWSSRELAAAADRLDCFHSKVCEAAAVLHLEAAASALEGDREGEAIGQVAAGRLIARRLAAPIAVQTPSENGRFLHGWHLAAGELQQAYGFHGAAFASYAAALELRPGDAPARLARASAVEASALPDGFGGVLVDEGSLLPLIGYAPGQRVASGLQQRLGDPASPEHVTILGYLAREYRGVLSSDPALVEARLRLGRVLAGLGRREEALAELRQVAQEGHESFELGLAHLCLARSTATAGEAVEEFRAAATGDPGLKQAWLGLSEALWRMGDRGAAAEALDHALGERQDLTSWVNYHLGRGRGFPEALAALRERVVTGP